MTNSGNPYGSIPSQNAYTPHDGNQYGNQSNMYGAGYGSPFGMQSPQQPQPQKPKKSKKKWVIGGAAALAFIAIAAGASGGSDNADDPAAASADSTSIVAESSDVNEGPSPTMSNSADGLDEPSADLNQALDDLDAALSGETGDSDTSDENSNDGDVPREYRNALRSAQNYVDMTAFSKAGLYEQLTSEYGEQFPADAAQYAVDNVNADWMAEAVEAAENYQELMPMSDAELFEQLTSEYGEKFTAEEAQHAVNSLGA